MKNEHDLLFTGGMVVAGRDLQRSEVAVQFKELAPLKEGRKLGDWPVPGGLVCLVGDIELVPE